MGKLSRLITGTPQETEVQRKKGRQVSLGIAGNDPVTQEVAQAGR